MFLPVEQDEEGDEPLEVEVLDDVVDEGLDLRVLRLGRDVQRLRDLQTLLQVAPTHLHGLHSVVSLVGVWNCGLGLTCDNFAADVCLRWPGINNNNFS